MRYSFLPFLAIISFWSCTSDNANTYRNGLTDIDLVVDTFQIDIDHTKLQHYTNGLIYLNNGDEMMMSYNYLLHSFDIFNISKQTCHGTVNLEKDGPNSVLNVSKYAIKNDTIIIQGPVFIYVVNLEGEVLKRFPLYDSFDNLDKKKYHFGRGIMFTKTKELCYDGKTKRIYIPIFENIAKNGNTIAFEPFIAEIDISNKTLKTIDIKKPETLRDNKYYGDLCRPFISLYRDKILYSFPLSPEIYILDPETNEIEEVKTEHINVKGSVEEIPFTWKAKMNFNYSNDSKQYFNIRPGLDDTYHYRLLQSDRKDNGEIKFFLSVFDPEFNLVFEKQVDFRNSSYCPGKNGLIVVPSIQDEKIDPDKLTLCRIKI
jgi:hypothetical protein